MTDILVVDDNPVDRELLATLLGYKGHSVFEASTAAAGLETAHDLRPNLIITDVLMPEMDGFEFLRQLRSDASVAATPVILSSGHYLEGESRKLAQVSESRCF